MRASTSSTELPGGRGHAVGFDPEIVSCPQVLEFHAYWQKIRGDRRFPSRRDIDPTAIYRLLPNILLLDVLRDPLDFEYRIIGEEVAAHLGGMKGRRVRATALLNVSSSAYQNYCAVVETGRPQFLQGYATPSVRDRPMLVSRVHCPLSSDGTEIDAIATCVAFKW